MKRVGFWKRLLAAGIDSAIVLSLTAIVGVVMAVGFPTQLDWLFEEQLYEMCFWLGVLVYSLSEVAFEGTPGKLVLGLAIAPANGIGNDVWRLLLRWSTKWWSTIFGIAWLMSGSFGCYWMAGLMNFVIYVGLLPTLGEDKQSWHDQWSGTAVFRRRAIVAPAPLVV